MTAQDPERARLEAAEYAPAFAYDRNAVKRRDVWRRFDRLVQIIGQRDHLIDSEVRKLVTELTAILSTLLPPDTEKVPCPECDIGVYGGELEEHLYYVHRGPVPAAWTS